MRADAGWIRHRGLPMRPRFPRWVSYLASKFDLSRNVVGVYTRPRHLIARTPPSSVY